MSVPTKLLAGGVGTEPSAARIRVPLVTPVTRDAVRVVPASGSESLASTPVATGTVGRVLDDGVGVDGGDRGSLTGLAVTVIVTVGRRWLSVAS